MAHSDATGTWNFGNFESIDPLFTTSSLDNADDWGDFMMTSNGFNHTLPQPVVQSTVTSSMNPIQFNLSNGDTTAVHKDADVSRWEKLKGAIPLSVFGLEEEDIGKSEMNGFSAEKNGGLTMDVQLETDRGAKNVRVVSNGLGKVHQASAEIPDTINKNVLPEWEVLMKVDGDNFRAEYSDLSINQLNWNPLTLKDKTTGFVSLQDLDMLENVDNSQNFAAGDSDEEDWEFKNAEVKLDAGNTNAKNNDIVSQKEGQTSFGEFDSMWPSVTIGFGESRSVVTNTNSNCFGDDAATDKITSNRNRSWQFQLSNPTDQAVFNESLEDNLIGPSIVSTVISGLRTNNLESTEANGEEEEWSFQAAKLDDSFELPIWNTHHSNGSLVKEENTGSTNGVSHDIWAHELWDIKDSGMGNVSTSQSYEIPANENSGSVPNSDGSQLLSSHFAGWNFSLDATPNEETGKAHSSSLPNDEDHAFEENSWGFVGAQVLENKSKPLSTEAGDEISDILPRGNGENHSFFIPNAESLVSEENSWSFVSAEASENKSEAPIAETIGKNFNTTLRGDKGILSSLLPNDESLVFEKNSWAFVGAEASENKSDAVSTPNKTAALPLSLFGEEETEFDSPVLNEELTENVKSKSGSSMHGKNVNIEDIVSSLYNQMETNKSTEQSINDVENGTVFPAEVNTLNLSSEVYNPDEDTWDFQDANIADQSNDFMAWDPTVNDDEHDEYVDVFEQLRQKLTLAVDYHLENHRTERNEALDTILKEFNHLQVEMPDEETSQEGIILNGQNLSKMFSEMAMILDTSKFNLFESEYSLSRALFMAEKGFEWSSALLKDVTEVLRILKLATKENRKNYVGVWLKILLASLKELKHGALIWKNLIEINAHHKILLESRGKDFIMSLREIYRVVEIVKNSSKFYKPWLCSLPSDSSEVLSSIDECIFVWSSSGLKEAYGILESGYSDSLQTVVDLVFECESPICQMSLLPESAVPDIQMVVWDGKFYFLNLANLWANLVDCQPPMLPVLSFHSIE